MFVSIFVQKLKMIGEIRKFYWMVRVILFTREQKCTMKFLTAEKIGMLKRLVL